MQGQDSWKNNNGQPDTSTKFTPQAIAKEMLDMLDGTESEKYLDKIDLDKNTKILNINCKTGIFLIHAIDKLDKALLERANHGEAGYENFKDSSYRKQYIINNQIYGLTLNDTDALLFQSRNVYGCINHPHIAYIKELYAGLRDINKKKQSESIEKTWIEKIRTEIDKAFRDKSAGSERQEHMDFDIVVGNPPYNDDLYLSFVTLGHAISTKCSIWITPAKWQGKSGWMNDHFRSSKVPYISKIVYFPDVVDVFDIDSQGGVAYYRLDKQPHDMKDLSVICGRQKAIESSNEKIDIRLSDGTCLLYGSKIRDILDKTAGGPKLKCMNRAVDGQYNVKITNTYSEKSLVTTNGTAYVTISPYIEKDTFKKNSDTSFLETFVSKSDADSYVSYLQTKFIRFLFLIAKISLHMQSKQAWRFIPDPGKFDHIYTDDELYRKYKITDDEKSMIEAIIKPRSE